ncbi:MAG: alpha/beta fold hydrolase [Acidobacteriia bacterium]|nr:alpha/beta fold hydrolase [Terriglobia bacterium]
MKFQLRFAAFALVTVLAFIHARADDLPRHGVVGLTIAPPDTTRSEDPKTNPPTVKAIGPGSAAEAAGIQTGDILRKLDGEPVASSADFAERIGRHLGGDRVAIVVQRGGREITLSATLKPHPYETSPDAQVLYRSVTVEGARRRVIVTRPVNAGRYPAVLIMGGLGCYSLDGDQGPYGPVIAALARKNFVTMRVENTGEGDSEGPACTDAKATAELEAQGYIAGLRALKSYEFVDPAKIFVFAHSLGPLVGSLVLPREPVRGFIAAETIGRSWFEYMLENVRRQFALAGQPPDEVDDAVRVHERCAHEFFVLHRPSDEVSRLAPQCAEMIDSFAGVPSTFMQQIGDISLARQWKQVDIPVLVLYGTSDPATSADEGQYLVELINRQHPGRATYVELRGMGHDFNRYDSQVDFMTRRTYPAKPHPFDEEVVEAVLKWLAQQLQP